MKSEEGAVAKFRRICSEFKIEVGNKNEKRYYTKGEYLAAISLQKSGEWRLSLANAIPKMFPECKETPGWHGRKNVAIDWEDTRAINVLRRHLNYASMRGE